MPPGWPMTGGRLAYSESGCHAHPEGTGPRRRSFNLRRPHVLANEPVLSIFERLPGSAGSFARLLATPREVFWCMLAGIAVGAVIQAHVAIDRPQGRRAVVIMRAMLAVLLGPFHAHLGRGHHAVRQDDRLKLRTRHRSSLVAVQELLTQGIS